VHPENYQIKHLPFASIKAEADGRTIKGIAGVIGNVDSQNDRILSGAFASTIANEFEKQKRVRHLWNHSFANPPTASITELKEIGRDQLPPAVLEKAPDAQGGLMVTRRYYDAELSNWILEAIKGGDITEMSFGYEPVQYEIKIEVNTDTGEETEIRELKEIRLFDTSDVLWGANAATIAEGAKSARTLHTRPLDVLVTELWQIVGQIKAGRRNATNDEKLINSIHSAAVSLGATECKGILTEAEPDEDSDTEKVQRRLALADSSRRLSFSKHDFLKELHR
jgi:HK97 family phage prohead protease